MNIVRLPLHGCDSSRLDLSETVWAEKWCTSKCGAVLGPNGDVSLLGTLFWENYFPIQLVLADTLVLKELLATVNLDLQ